MVAELPPYPFINDAYEGGKALVSSIVGYDDVYKTDLWVSSVHKEKGLTRHDSSQAYKGLTLYTSSHDQAAYLIDMDGTVVHTWMLSYDTYREKGGRGMPTIRDKRYAWWRKAHVFPNGDLLAVCEGSGITPWGLALIKIDRNSRMLWVFPERVHHDFSIGENGRIYALTHAIRKDPPDGIPGFKAPFLDDFVVVLSPDGKLEQKVSVSEAILQSGYDIWLQYAALFENTDYFHTNAVRVLEKNAASFFPGAQIGNVMISLRNTSTLAILDIEAKRIVWTLQGCWVRQHDPDILDDGGILLFDNLGPLDGNARVVEIDARTHEIKWSYGGADNTLRSILRSAQQRLPNGNTLITESDGGRLLEVNPEGETVWEFINPAPGGTDPTKIAVVSFATRYSDQYFEREFLSQLPK